MDVGQRFSSMHMWLVEKDYFNWEWVVLMSCIEPILVHYIDVYLETKRKKLRTGYAI